jgi:alpha-beta hydrolase superfamily lysophospholipase
VLSLKPRSFSTDEQAYLKFYGLDFSAEHSAVTHSLGTLESGGQQLAVQVWQSPGAASTLLLVHGYFDHVGLFRQLVHFGLERGSNVVAFDLPGHGLSTGNEADIDSFERYRQAIADVLEAVATLPGSRQVIAQSAGAAAVLEYLTSDPKVDFSRVVLLAPLVRPKNWLLVRAGHQLLHRFVDHIPRKFAQNSSDRGFLEFLQTDPLQSKILPVGWIGALKQWLPNFLRRPGQCRELLILQGDNDDTVDWKYNLKRLQQMFPRAVVHMIPGAGHHLANESASIRSKYLAVVSSYLDEDGLDNEALPGKQTSATLLH